MDDFDTIMAQFEEEMAAFEDTYAEYQAEMREYRALVDDSPGATAHGTSPVGAD